MKGIISIQSHTVFGHAGNSSAVFPVQRMGIEMWPIHTLQRSDHTHYSQGCVEEAFSACDILKLVKRLDDLEQLTNCEAIISGQAMNDEQCRAVCEVVELVKSRNPQAWYVCEPTVGTTLEQDLLAHADVIVLGAKALSHYTGMPIQTLDEAVLASQAALEIGPKMVLVKELEFFGEGTSSLLLTTAKVTYLCQRPQTEMESQLVGVEDLITAIFCACLVKKMSPVAALRHTNNAVYGVLDQTQESHSLELETVSAQYEFVEPTFDFPVTKINV
ncbi:pyridoxal kinase [Vibrio cholerae]|uniref:pyridoxal kinase n=1 Tax=Vibrio cholerae TaxID=666 RepID=UPI001A9FB3C3|nr:pyridoxal kinase [Vibrio cholerae]EGR0792311.1 pyridoxal kinase [Vibrio cholerae]EGR0806815.1 pyridoxal kinase [Vibrio cholerae]EGR0811527.1 pyridoxal kinase [Vibrio cholerae]EGR0872489.1 pyridoxal kinase [Vibrio cholerae]EJE4212367.1 pyridoxal kinase [Vibrio cholerae]